MVVLFFTASAGSCRDCEMMRNKFYSDREFMNWISRFAVSGEVDISAGRTDFQEGRETYSMVGGEIAPLLKVVNMQRSHRSPCTATTGGSTIGPGRRMIRARW